MADSRRIHVNKRPDGQWEAEREGAQRASAVTGTQREALERAREIAQKSGPSQIIVHRPNGQIREERTYNRKDPFPPEG